VNAYRHRAPAWFKARLMKIDLAAAYVDCCPVTFRKGIKAGFYPQAAADAPERWDVRDLDAAIDRLKQGGKSEPALASAAADPYLAALAEAGPADADRPPQRRKAVLVEG
jgi:hypothetical protein